MRTHVVFTLTGPDRVGIVEEVTGELLGLGGNVQGSRMARLGGEFAMLVLLSLPEGSVDQVQAALDRFAARGYRVGFTPTRQHETGAFPEWRPYSIEVEGADHEGIIHDIARGLAAAGINIESMDTETKPAPASGTPLFRMVAQVLVPPELAEESWTETLRDAADQANVDVEVSARQ